MMNDSLLTIFSRQEAIFHHSFDYTGRTIVAKAPGADSVLTPGIKSFIVTGTSDGMPVPAGHMVSSDWVFWFILAGFFLLAMFKFHYEKRLGLLISSAVSRNAAGQFIRESTSYGAQGFLILIAIFIISALVLVYQVIQYIGYSHEPPEMDLLMYLKIVGLYLSFLLVKFSLIKMSGFLFRNPETANEYIQNIIIFNILTGIALLPLVLLIHYGPGVVFLYVTFGVLAILLITRFVKGVFIGMSDQKFSLFHLFLYLCTLEILPVLIIVKFLDKYFFS